MWRASRRPNSSRRRWGVVTIEQEKENRRVFMHIRSQETDEAATKKLRREQLKLV
jgi:hypothetical protein